MIKSRTWDRIFETALLYILKCQMSSESEREILIFYHNKLAKITLWPISYGHNFFSRFIDNLNNWASFKVSEMSTGYRKKIETIEKVKKILVVPILYPFLTL